MTALKYAGAKNQIADWILSYFPAGYKRTTYLEPFFGSGVVFFRKERSTVETINDIDNDIVNFFAVLREQPEKLVFLIHNTPWSRTEYDLSKEDCDDTLEKARRFLVKHWFSIGARGETFRINKKGNNGNLGGFHSQLPTELLRIADRLKNQCSSIVQIEHKDALELIPQYNRKNVFMYLDPPYLLKTRKNRKIYPHELSDEQHIKLLTLIKQSKAYIMLSGYDNDLYNSQLKGWKKEQKMVCSEKEKKVETIWMNYNSYQYLLFE